MLVLTRRIGEEIVINGNIHVVVLDARRDRIRLGVTAPTSVRVNRMEVQLRHDHEGEGGQVAPPTIVGANELSLTS